MLQKFCYYALKASCWVRYALGLTSRKKYKETKFLLKFNLLSDSNEYSRVNMSHSWYKTNFHSYFTENKEILHEKYLRLIDGLDDESARTIQVIISRLMNYYQSSERGFAKMIRYEATNDEMQMFKQIERDLYSRIIRFPNGITSYKKWLLPSAEFQIIEPGVFYSKHFIEELDGLHGLRSKDILDIGAYNWRFGHGVRGGYTDKKVYSFDPSPRHIEKMIETINLNNSNKIVPVALGLGDKTEELSMKCHILMEAEDTFVKLTTLDEWIKSNNVDVGVIKVDIEGLEQKFLCGAIETIRKYKPALLISIYHNASDMFEIKPFIEDLNLGYKFKIRRAFDKHILRDTMLICESRGDC